MKESLISPQKSKKCFGVFLQPGVTISNYMGFLISGFTASAFVITVSIMLVLLLQDTRYYNIPAESQGKVLGSMIVITEVVGIVMYQITGFCYDFMGRKWILIIATILGSFSMAVMPYCQDVWPWLVIARMLASIAGVAIMANPLLVDYVSEKSKGLASAELGLSGTLAGAFIILVEFRLAASINLAYFFEAHALLCLLGALYFFFFIDDVYKKPESHSSQGFLKSLKQSFKILFTEACGKIEITVALLGNFVIKMVDTLLLALSTQWYSQWEFHGNTAQTSQFVNTYYGLALIFAIAIGFLFGCFADRIDYKALLAPILIITGCLYMPIYLSTCMTCDWTVILMSFNLTILLGSNVVLLQLIARNIQSQTSRGTLMGAFHFCGGVGSIIFALVGGYLVSSKEFNKWIYLLGSILCISMGILSYFIFSCRRSAQ